MNGRPPIHHGESIEGFCGLCNDLLLITARVYFVCIFCWNVIVAYQKSFVAAKAVHDYWKNAVISKMPALRLRETEVPYLSPYARSGKSKKAAAVELTFLDFIVERDGKDGSFGALFHIELKSGPGSIDAMSKFQLDINDSNDIIGVVNNTRLPAYIFHVQLSHRYRGPTRQTVAAGMWFTDIFTLLSKRLSVKTRRDEEKKAGYYSPSAFKPIDDFSAFLGAAHHEELLKRLSGQALEMT